MYHVTIRYILLGRPLALPTEFLTRFHPHQRLSFLGITDIAGNGWFHTT